MRFTVGSRQKAYDLAGRVDTSDGVELSWQNDENVGLEEMEDRLRVIVIYGDREFMHDHRLSPHVRLSFPLAENDISDSSSQIE